MLLFQLWGLHPPPVGLTPQQRRHLHHQPTAELCCVLIGADSIHSHAPYSLQDGRGMRTGLKLEEHLKIGFFERLIGRQWANQLRENKEGMMFNRTACPEAESSPSHC